MISLALLRLLPLLAPAAHAATTHFIKVGGPGTLTYDPPSTMADPGDTISFVFHEKNHTATQAAFNAPCQPLAAGFDSGFMPVPAGTMDGFPTYTITINDTNPIWGYCRQQGPPNHCNSGMVFAINPTADKTFNEFQAAAEALSGSASGAASVASSTASAASSWTSPPPPVIETVTATVTVFDSVYSAATTYTTTYASWESAPADPTPAAQPAVHTVIVGGSAGLVYTPNNITANIGDMVVFEFHQKNHTVTQSSFNNPCSMLTSPMSGFDSGFMPVGANATSFPTFNYTVNTTTPVWAYCRQPGPPAHCQQGMVFGINPGAPGSPNDMEAFIQLAMHSNVSNVATPGGGNGSSPSGSGSSSSPSPSSSSGSSGSNGAGRAAVSVGLGAVITGFAVAALL